MNTKMKQIAAFFMVAYILFATMLLYGNNAAAESEYVYTCICPETQYVNVRKQPRSDAGTWGKLHRGDEIEVEGIKDGFIEFTFNGRKAYVSVNYFEREDDAEYVVVGNGRVRVRSTPNGDRVGWIEPGTVVKVKAWRYGTDGGLWAKANGSFISCAFLVKNEEATRW